MAIYKRGERYYIDLSISDSNGRPVRIRRSGGKTEEAAKRLEAQLLLQHQAGAPAEVLAAPARTLSDAVKLTFKKRWGGWPQGPIQPPRKHEESVAPRGSRSRYWNYKKSLYVQGVLGDIRLDDFGQKHVDKLVDSLRDTGRSEPTIRRFLSFLGTVMKTADVAGWTKGAAQLVYNAAAELSDSQGRTRTLTDKERAGVFEYIRIRKSSKRDELLVFFMLLTLTGCRVGEALKLTRDDLKAGLLVFRAATTKAGKTRKLPVPQEALDALGRIVEPSGDAHARVFTLTYQTVLRAWNGARRHLGIAPGDVEFVPHAIRHTVATELVRRFPVAVSQKLLGHANMQTTQKYVHLDTEDLEEASGHLADRLPAGLLTPESVS